MVTNDYVHSAVARGESTRWILRREVLPNIAAPLIGAFSLYLTSGIVFVSTLSFLGLGDQPPSSSWDLMVAESRGFIATNPVATLAPAVDRRGVVHAGRRRHHPPRRARYRPRPTGPVTGIALEAGAVSVAYHRPDRSMATVVSQVSLSLEPGRVLGLVGESGCRKSSLGLACLAATPDGGAITSGSVTVDGLDLLTAPPQTLRTLWGRHLAHVPQNPANSLHPAMRIGRQLAQPITTHLGLTGRELRGRATDLLDRVGITNPGQALRRYPHEFSGGQQQRIALALAISCDPRVLILDEPTTGLDVTTQTRIVTLLKGIITGTRAAALYISHDLALVSTVADRLLVMYAGEIVESGATPDVVGNPRHPYTRALLAALPSAHQRRAVRVLAGRPPGHVVLDECTFAPRCTYAQPECVAGHPLLQPLRGSREVRYVRHDQLESRPHSVAGWALPA